MKASENATFLIEKFGEKAINQVNYAIDIWETKLEFAKEEKDNNKLDICLRTLKYWNNVKNIIN